ncbi:MAG: hypothetical protein IMZ64_08100, partial [Bacteroidetes bacterium]|nr:hypothetical protein [Bacteroidota bacterium]
MPKVKEDLKQFDIAINGKFRNDVDPLMLQKGDFRQLTNYRYVNDGIKGIKGMTKINTLAADYPKIDGGFHYRKDQPTESHVLVQTTSVTNSRLVKSDNTTTIPAQDTFSNFLSLQPKEIEGYYSQYPPTQNDTYVKATSRWTVDEGVGHYYYPYQATNPTVSLTGLYPNKSWISENGSTTNQRFHIDLGSDKIIKRIYYENSHYGGLYTDRGVYQFTFWGSNTAGAFAELTYGTDTNWTQLTTSQNTFDEHIAANQEDPKYITVNNSTSFRYYAFKFANARVAEYYMAVRRIELQSFAGTVPTTTSHDKVYFNNAPDDSMMAMDGNTNWIWSGLETRCARFINFSLSESFWYDYTTEVNNTLQDTKNIAPLHTDLGGVDDNTMTLLHLNNNITDARTTGGHTWNNSNVTYNDSGDGEFSGYSAVFNGTNARLSTAASGDFDLSGGVYTIEARIKMTEFTDPSFFPIYYQHTTSSADSFSFFIYNGTVILSINTTAGGEVLRLTTPFDWNLFYGDGFTHIALVENGNSYYIFIDGALRAYTSSAIKPANYTGTIYNGYGYCYDPITTNFDELYGNGREDEFRVSNSARWTGNFTPPISEYSASNGTNVYVASTRPIQGVKWYIKTANTATAAVSGSEWTGVS